MVVRSTIELKEGVAVELLATPSLYRVAKQRGIDLVADANTDATGVMLSYLKMIYCAAINAWDVRRVDEPKLGAFPYKYADFDEWAWSNQPAFTEAVRFVFSALTGKELQAAEGKDVKKK